MNYLQEWTLLPVQPMERGFLIQDIVSVSTNNYVDEYLEGTNMRNMLSDSANSA